MSEPGRPSDRGAWIIGAAIVLAAVILAWAIFAVFSGGFVVLSR